MRLKKENTKMQLVKSIVSLGWLAGTSILRHTPKAIALVADAKHKLTDSISEEYAKYQKELKEIALNEKIEKLKNNKKEH